VADVDNLLKFILDALSGILYRDDRQIVSVRAVKRRSKVATGITKVTIAKYFESESTA